MSGAARNPTDDVGTALAATAASVSAPDALRERIATDRTRRPRQRGRALALALACVVLAVAAVGTLLLTSGGAGAPTVAATADVALLPASAPAPAADARDANLLRAGVGAIRFPSYAEYDDWRVAGSRRDELAGRNVVTVAYDGNGHRIAYAIVAGAPLERPGGRELHRDGKGLTVLRRDGATVVTWRQQGHTCVLASRSAPLRDMLALASWS
jgi:hypothetical protein